MKKYMNYKIIGVLACSLIIAFGVGYYVNSAPSATTIGDNIEAKGTICDGSGNCLGDAPELPEWVDVTSDTDPFDRDCEYRWYNPDYNSGTMFYPTVVNESWMGTDWSAGAWQAVWSSDKTRSTSTAASNNITTEMRCE